MAKVSTLFYRNVNGVAEMLEIPTIQSLTIPDNTTIPSKPTIVGEYRNQYVAAAPVKVSFTAWLEGEQYIDNSMDVSTVLDKLIAIRDNRILFNLTTTHTEEESRFLSDLAIENISFNRDANRRNRLVTTVNCTQIKMINLTWKQASAVEIFGHEIFTSQDTSTVKMDFIPGKVDEDFDLLSSNASGLNGAFNWLNSAISTVGYESGLKQAPVSWQIKKAIENDVQLVNNSYYYKLTEPIDMTLGSRTYNCNCAFQSKYGAVGSSAKPYTVDLGQFVITTTKDDGVLVSNFPTAFALGSKAVRSPYWNGIFGKDEPYQSSARIYANNAAAANAEILRGSKSSYPYVYDFADSYPGFTISKTFEYVESFDGLAKYLQTAPISSDEKTIGNGNVIIKDGYIWTYKIKDRYDFSIGYGNTVKKYVPDGGLKIDKFNLTTIGNGFKPKISNDAYQTVFDDAFRTGNNVNYSVTVVAVTLGTLLQVYLFSNTLFQRSILGSNGSSGPVTPTGVASGP